MNVKKLLLPAVLGLSTLFAQATDTAKEAGKKAKTVAEKTADVTKSAAKKTAEGAKTVGEKTADVTKDAAKATKKGAEKAAEKTVEVSKDAAKATKKGAEKVGEKTADTAKEVAGKKKEAAPAVTGGTANAKEIADAKTKGLVWLNLDSKIYHKEGQHYGTTKNGKFVTEAEAQKMGGVAAKTGAVGAKK